MNRWVTWIGAFLLLAGTLLIFFLRNTSAFLDADEIWTMCISRQPLQRIWFSYLGETDPLYASLAVGLEHILPVKAQYLTLKWFSVLCTYLSALLMYLFVAKHYNFATGIATGALIVFHPQIVLIGGETRSFALLTFLYTASLILLISLFNSSSFHGWRLYLSTLLIASLFHTNALGWLAIAVQVLWLLLLFLWSSDPSVRRGITKIFIMWGIVLILSIFLRFRPTLGFIVASRLLGSNELLPAWQPALSWIAKVFIFLLGSPKLSLLTGLMALLGGYYLVNDAKKDINALLWLFAFGVPCISFLVMSPVAFVKNPMEVCTFVIPILAFFIAFGVGKCNLFFQPFLRTTVFLLIVGLMSYVTLSSSIWQRENPTPERKGSSIFFSWVRSGDVVWGSHSYPFTVLEYFNYIERPKKVYFRYFPQSIANDCGYEISWYYLLKKPFPPPKFSQEIESVVRSIHHTLQNGNSAWVIKEDNPYVKALSTTLLSHFSPDQVTQHYLPSFGVDVIQVSQPFQR